MRILDLIITLLVAASLSLPSIFTLTRIGCEVYTEPEEGEAPCKNAILKYVVQELAVVAILLSFITPYFWNSLGGPGSKRAAVALLGIVNLTGVLITWYLCGKCEDPEDNCKDSGPIFGVLSFLAIALPLLAVLQSLQAPPVMV